MTELAGKGKRVLGMFLLMVGAGVILDSHAAWAGTVVLLCGGGVFAWGLIEARPRAALVRADVAPPRPSESNL